MSPAPKPSTSTPADVPVARIAGVFGIRGELKCDPTSAGRAAISAGAQLRCAGAAQSTTIRVASARPHKGRLLIRIAGVDDADAAAAYAGATLFAPRAAISLGQGEYLDEDLVGCAVRGVDGTDYGSIERVEHYPSSDMLVVAGRMVPMVHAIVIEIDVERGCVTIDPPLGLID
jgi:16S rRNA processing protein RimM